MNKTEVLHRIDDGWRRLTQLVDEIDAKTFVKPGKDGWSPKDHVAHVTAWEEFLLAILEKRDRYEGMGAAHLREKDTDEINNAVIESRRRLSPEAVRSAFAGTHRKVRSAIESLSDSDLQRPRAEYQPDTEDAETGEESLLDEIEWNTWGHYEKHIEWLAALITK